MDQIAPNSSGGEVIIISSPPQTQKQAPSRKNHFITWFYSDTSEIAPIINRCKEITIKGMAQTEICPTTKRKHIHLMLWGKKKFRDTELKLPKNSYNGQTLKDVDNTSDYANKSDSHDGVFREKWGFPTEIKHYCMFNTWQQWLLDTVTQTEPDLRKVYWFWSKNGKLGKTALLKWIADKHNGQFCLGGTARNISNLIYHTDMDTCRCMMFALALEDEKNVNYKAIEHIKDGLCQNMKSHTNGTKIYNAPHVIIFANYPPDTTKLIKDRWIIHQIDWMNEVKGPSGLKHPV